MAARRTGLGRIAAPASTPSTDTRRKSNPAFFVQFVARAVLGAFILLFGNSFAAYATAYALTSSSVNLVPIQIGAVVNGNVFSDPQAVYGQFRRLVLGIDRNGGGQGRIRGLPQWNLDMGVTKEFKFTERVGATFNALITNVLNHWQPTINSFNLDNPSAWGVVSATDANYPQRKAEFGLRIAF